MGKKSKSKSKGKRVKKSKNIKKVESLPKHPKKGTIYKMDTKRGTRYFEGTGREMMQQTKKPK